MKITEQEIKKRLIGLSNTVEDRELFKVKHKDSPLKEMGTVFYSLVGSPPKAFAVYIPEIKQLNFYNAKGRRTKFFSNAIVQENIQPDRAGVK